MQNVFFYLICALIAAVPAFASGKKVQSASEEVIAKARAAAAAEDSVLLEEATQSLTVSESGALPNDSQEATITEAAALVPQEESVKALTQDEIKNMKESEIPLVGAKETKKSEGSPWFRLLTTVGVISVLLGGATFGIKRYGKRSNGSKGTTTKIRVVTQYHLGPKKSLLIVNVAGESLLLGVTDHNISILKNLSLLDEELPADVPNTFAGAINESFVENSQTPSEESEDDFAIQGLAQIKDKVSSRLKNMRQI